MSCLRNASFPNAELVLLLGGSGTRLFLTRFKSSLRMLDVMSVNARPFNTYLFWGSRSHRSKTEAYVMTVRSPPPSRPLWVLLGRVQRALLERIFLWRKFWKQNFLHLTPRADQFTPDPAFPPVFFNPTTPQPSPAEDLLVVTCSVPDTRRNSRSPF